MKILKNNEWRDLTLKRAKEQLVELGVVLKHRDGKYVVRKRGSPVEYALGDLDAALDQGWMIAQNIEPMDIRRCSKEELDEPNRLGNETSPSSRGAASGMSRNLARPRQSMRMPQGKKSATSHPGGGLKLMDKAWKNWRVWRRDDEYTVDD